MTDVRIIKRYANRKLYDTQHSRYVTLDQISEMIRNGDDVKIIDNKSKEDLTSVTLAQIIFEEEKKQRSFLPLQAMRNIIQNGGESFAQFVNEAQRRVTSILPLRKDEDGQEIAEGTTAVDAADSAGAGEGQKSDEQSAVLKRPRDGFMEFREWIQQSQRTIEEWQKRVDDRVRNVARGISPFSGLQKDVQALGSRIAELEAKLSQLAESEKQTEATAAADEPAQTTPNESVASEPAAGETAGSAPAAEPTSDSSPA